MSELTHYGTPRYSGRYPWGSGDDPYQSFGGFNKYVNNLKKDGLTEREIADYLDIRNSKGEPSINKLRARISISSDQQRRDNISEAQKLKDKGMSNVAIGKQMGVNESVVRSWLKPGADEKANVTMSIANMLKENVDKTNAIDVGVGIENHLGISKDRLNKAVAILEEQGYKVQYLQVEQVGNPGYYTSVKVLSKPDMAYKDLYENRDKIGWPGEYSEDQGRSWRGIEPVKSVSSDRIKIIYNEEGGADKDGAIELRPGVDDISLGNSRYAQVRIGVDDTHYLKGMAIYGDNFPDGVDILYYSNKPKGTDPKKVFKSMDTIIKNDVDTGVIDKDNPFGATVRQKHYIDSNGKEQLSALNIIREEGEWNEWSKTLSSQFLSKQSTSLAERQLNMSYDVMKEEYDTIMSVTNPAVKKRLLYSFAEDCDSQAVHLKAAALPRQRNQVIMPIPEIKETEVYAPNFRNGEQVVLIRHPHGGKFEIPQLTVNNNNPSAKKVLGQAADAIGINAKVAERLSGADFDGDTVLVIPNSPRVGVKTSPPLKALRDFDPKTSYPERKGMKYLQKGSIGREMGNISNLITDMSLQGATDSELARAVKHSMVVIDANKHKLDYKQSFGDNQIAALKTKYQGKATAGAATLISRASSDKRVDQRSNTYKIDPDTGKRIYKETGATYTNKAGKTVKRQTKSTKMAEVDDAFKLSSGTQMEETYATHANKLKTLANEARKEYVKAPNQISSPSAKKTYAKEVSSLDAKLNTALKNAPLERKAQLVADQLVKARKDSSPNMDKDEEKKIKTQALAEARVKTGAKKQEIKIEPKEWEAIQAGAISNNKLTKILNNADLNEVKKLSTPRTQTGIPKAKEARAKAMLAQGYTQSDIADILGISTSAVNNLK